MNSVRIRYNRRGVSAVPDYSLDDGSNLALTLPRLNTKF